MSMRLVSLAALLALGAPAWAQAPVPRKSPDFTIVEPSGKQMALSSYKGKVIVLEFLYTTCPHCQAASQVFTKLYKEWGPRGFQPLGVAFNDNAALLVKDFVQQFNVGYPVGYSTPDKVLAYLGYSLMDTRYVVPQVVVIDRKGMIRAQSPPQGDEKLQEEAPLRILIDRLLKEGPATGNQKSSTPRRTS